MAYDPALDKELIEAFHSGVFGPTPADLESARRGIVQQGKERDAGFSPVQAGAASIVGMILPVLESVGATDTASRLKQSVEEHTPLGSGPVSSFGNALAGGMAQMPVVLGAAAAGGAVGGPVGAIAAPAALFGHQGYYGSMQSSREASVPEDVARKAAIAPALGGLAMGAVLPMLPGGGIAKGAVKGLEKAGATGAAEYIAQSGIKGALARGAIEGTGMGALSQGTEEVTRASNRALGVPQGPDSAMPFAVGFGMGGIFGAASKGETLEKVATREAVPNARPSPPETRGPVFLNGAVDPDPMGPPAPDAMTIPGRPGEEPPEVLQGRPVPKAIDYIPSQLEGPDQNGFGLTQQSPRIEQRGQQLLGIDPEAYGRDGQGGWAPIQPNSTEQQSVSGDYLPRLAMRETPLVHDLSIFGDVAPDGSLTMRGGESTSQVAPDPAERNALADFERPIDQQVPNEPSTTGEPVPPPAPGETPTVPPSTDASAPETPAPVEPVAEEPKPAESVATYKALGLDQTTHEAMGGIAKDEGLKQPEPPAPNATAEAPVRGRRPLGTDLNVAASQSQMFRTNPADSAQAGFDQQALAARMKPKVEEKGQMDLTDTPPPVKQSRSTKSAQEKENEARRKARPSLAAKIRSWGSLRPPRITKNGTVIADEFSVPLEGVHSKIVGMFRNKNGKLSMDGLADKMAEDADYEGSFNRHQSSAERVAVAGDILRKEITEEKSSVTAAWDAPNVAKENDQAAYEEYASGQMELPKSQRDGPPEFNRSDTAEETSWTNGWPDVENAPHVEGPPIEGVNHNEILSKVAGIFRDGYAVKVVQAFRGAEVDHASKTVTIGAGQPGASVAHEAGHILVAHQLEAMKDPKVKAPFRPEEWKALNDSFGDLTDSAARERMMEHLGMAWDKVAARGNAPMQRALRVIAQTVRAIAERLGWKDRNPQRILERLALGEIADRAKSGDIVRLGQMRWTRALVEGHKAGTELYHRLSNAIAYKQQMFNSGSTPEERRSAGFMGIVAVHDGITGLEDKWMKNVGDFLPGKQNFRALVEGVDKPGYDKFLESAPKKVVEIFKAWQFADSKQAEEAMRGNHTITDHTGKERPWKALTNYMPRDLTPTWQKAIREGETNPLYAHVMEAYWGGKDPLFSNARGEGKTGAMRAHIAETLGKNLERNRALPENTPDMVVIDGKEVWLHNSDPLDAMRVALSDGAHRLGIRRFVGDDKAMAAHLQGILDEGGPNARAIHDQLKAHWEILNKTYDRQTSAALEPLLKVLAPLEGAARIFQLSASFRKHISNNLASMVVLGPSRWAKSMVDSAISVIPGMRGPSERTDFIRGLMADSGLGSHYTLANQAAFSDLPRAMINKIGKYSPSARLFEGIIRWDNMREATAAYDWWADATDIKAGRRTASLSDRVGGGLSSIDERLRRFGAFSSENIQTMKEIAGKGEHATGGETAQLEWLRMKFIQNLIGRTTGTNENPLMKQPFLSSFYAKKMTQYFTFERLFAHNFEDYVGMAAKGDPIPLLLTLPIAAGLGTIQSMAGDLMFNTTDAQKKKQEDTFMSSHAVDYTDSQRAWIKAYNIYKESAMLGMNQLPLEMVRNAMKRGKLDPSFEVPTYQFYGQAITDLAKGHPLQALEHTTPIARAVDAHMEGPVWTKKEADAPKGYAKPVQTGEYLY